MKNKVMELLNNQKEARNVLAVEIIDEAKALLMDLGCEHLLTSTGETIVKEIPVEIIKEIKVEVPVETIKEVKVEVIKEVPVEVVREVEVVKSSDEDKKTIKELNKEIKKINKALEYNKGVNVTLREKIKELKKVKPAVKEVPDTKALAEAAKEHSKIVMGLKNQIAAKDSIIAALNEKIKELEGNAANSSKNSNARVHVEEPVNDNVEGLHIIKNYDSHIIGRYNGVPFEAMKNVEGTNIYDPTKWDMKDEINQVLVDAGYIATNRNVKDNYRVECETGSCHEISDKKYMGYVVVDGVAYSYVFNTNYQNGYPCCVELDKYLANPTQVKRNACGKKAIITAINSLIDMRNAKVKELQESSDDILKALGCSASDNDNATDNSSRLAQTNDKEKDTVKDKEPENVEPEVPAADGFDFGALDFSDTPVPEQEGEEEEDTIDGNPRSWYFAEDSDNDLW